MTIFDVKNYEKYFFKDLLKVIKLCHPHKEDLKFVTANLVQSCR